MTQDPKQPDNSLALPEAEAISPADRAENRSGVFSPGLKFAILIGGVFVVIVGGIFWTTQQELVKSNVSAPPALDATPGGDIQAENPAYQEAVKRANERRAQLAEEFGVTSMPTPEGVLQPTDERAAVDILDVQEPVVEDTTVVEAQPESQAPQVSERRILAAPPPPVQTQKAEPAQTGAAAENGNAQEKPPENPFTAKMAGQMAATSQSLAAKKMQSGSIESVEDPSAEVAAASGEGAGGNGIDPMAPENLLLRPGDILYAETISSVNSDMQAPVLAEVITGPLKGARLTGTFTSDRAAARMVVKFSNMTLEDGRVFTLDGYAVDGKSAEMAVASDVERRYIARYAPILASTFISGYAQSAAQVGSTISGTGDNSVIVEGEASARQNVLAGVAAAAGAISEDIMEGAPKGPKIILRDGYPIGILIVAPVSNVSNSGMATASSVPALAQE